MRGDADHAPVEGSSFVPKRDPARDVDHNGEDELAALWRAAIELSEDSYSIVRAVRRDGAVVDWEFVAASSHVHKVLSPDRPMRGRRWSDVNGDWADGDRILAMLGDAERSAARQACELEVMSRSGRTRWLHTTAAPIDGDTLVVVSRDITARRRAERDADDERARFRLLIEHSPGGLVVLDDVGTTKYVSPRAAELFGMADDREPVDARAMLSRVAGTDAMSLREWFRAVVEHGAGAIGLPIAAPVALPDGSTWVCEYTAQNRLDDPLIAGIVVHFHDITALARTEARSRALAENASDVVLLTDGVTVQWISQAVERLLGYKVGDLVGTDPMELVHPDDREEMVTRTAESIMAGGDSSEAMVVRVVAADGTTRWFEAWARNRLEDPLLSGMLVYLQDVTERQRATDALRNSEARTRSLLDTAPDAIITVDAAGIVVEFNRAAEATFGWTAAEIVGRSYTEILPADDADGLRALTAHGTRSARMFQSRGKHRSGALFPLQGSIATVDVGGDRVFTTIVRDVTEQKAIESRLKILALNDPLTGLPNRQRVLECTGEALLRAEQEGLAVAALFIDLDRFKLVNDTLGHQVGDDLLREAATRITGVTRDTDIVGRLGGDEFVIICTDVSNGITGPVRLAQRLTQAFSKPFELAGRSLFVTASIGIGFAGDATTSPSDLLRQADTAMYRSKENGRARFELFDHTMQNWVAERLDVETSLRLAIAGNEIVPFYQPIVELTSGQTIKLEALARWLRPGKGVVPPRDFIEIAEEAGLINAIGNAMLERATIDCQSWQSIMPGVGVTVNVSARRFATPDLDSAVERVLANNGLNPELLTIEITESALLIDPDSVIEQLRALREVGVRVALDDFGTGYSSLTYLRTLPIDTLKIDKTFIDALATNEHDSSIVEAILALARARGLEVIAEGIENAAVARRLEELGCLYGQGFLYARPAPLDALRSREAQREVA
jgi:diguanylate cyclase (GGDEF)-like protein/PAS domain S-box-containing protein